MLGFSLAATLGTAGYLRGRGLVVETLVAKVGEEGVAPTPSSSSPRARCSWSSTPRAASGPRADGQHIRAAAVVHQVPCLTTLAAARAAAAGIADARAHPLQVRASRISTRADDSQ